MSKSIADELMQRRRHLLNDAQQIARAGVTERRDLTAEEQTSFDKLIAESDQLATRATAIAEGEAGVHDLEQSFRNATGHEFRGGQGGGAVHPLFMPSSGVDAVSAAVREGRSFRWVQNAEERAALTTAGYGTSSGWHGFAADGPALLHVIGGAHQERLDGLGLSFPTWTLPTASASVGQNVTLGEYASTTGGSLTTARFGRFTDLSAESALNGVAAITRLHRLGIARDLNADLVNKLEATAGTATLHSTSAEFMVRRGLAKIADATASDVTSLVVIVHPDDAALLQDTNAANGDDQGSVVRRFAGAQVFASSAQTAGVALIANIGMGVVYGVSADYTVDTHVDPKTGTNTLGSSVIAGYGIGIPEAVTAVDIVSP